MTVKCAINPTQIDCADYRLHEADMRLQRALSRIEPGYYLCRIACQNLLLPFFLNNLIFSNARIQNLSEVFWRVPL